MNTTTNTKATYGILDLARDTQAWARIDVAETAEFNGTSRRDDIRKSYTLDMDAVEFENVPCKADNPSFMLRTAIALNQSVFHGWASDEYRSNGSKFRRAITEQPLWLTDNIQMDGGDTGIVAVEVDGQAWVVQWRKLWLNAKNPAHAKRWYRMNPSRNTMPTGSVFVYMPERYLPHGDGYSTVDEASDYAFRWSQEIKLTNDADLGFNERHTLHDPDGYGY